MSKSTELMDELGNKQSEKLSLESDIETVEEQIEKLEDKLDDAFQNEEQTAEIISTVSEIVEDIKPEIEPKTDKDENQWQELASEFRQIMMTLTDRLQIMETKMDKLTAPKMEPETETEILDQSIPVQLAEPVILPEQTTEQLPSSETEPLPESEAESPAPVLEVNLGKREIIKI